LSLPSRKYYERTNELIEQYLYIDCLLDSSIPHELLNEYADELQASAYPSASIPATIQENEALSPIAAEGSAGARPPSSAMSYGTVSVSTPTTQSSGEAGANGSAGSGSTTPSNLKRTPTYILRPSESMPLLQRDDEDEDEHDDGHGAAAGNGAASWPADPKADGSGPRPNLPWLEDAEVDSDSPVVTLAIWVNFIANAVLLLGKIAVVVTTPSMSVLASLVDAALDFLSTTIVWVTTRLIASSQKDQFKYPVGRRRLEPVGVLVFSVIMITSFFQVALESIQRLAGPDRSILELTIPALAIMVSTVVVKGAVWVWCRMVRNSSVRAL
jgi:hypothetical protein